MSSNYVEALVDEIALEGLDGITLQALWIRLAERKGFDFYLDEKSKEFLWNIIKKLKNVEFFILPKARGDLIIPEIKEDTDLGEASMQMQLVLKQLYPHCIVDVNGIRGSCPSFDTRVKAHENIKLLSVEDCQAKWGGRLVLVASQQTRTHALMVGCKVPYTDMVVSHYCVLERIGRSRHYGVFTYGPGSIQDMVKEDPRSHFYIRKKFFELDLITKQPQTLKLKGVSSHCFLLHLNRFFVVIKSESAVRQEQIFSILKSAPEHFVEYDYLRSALAMPGTAFKKVVSLMHRKGLINSHARVTYRTVHPDATPTEWSRKNTGLEKTLRVVVLGCSDKVEKNVDEEESVPNSDDEEADETDGKWPKGVLSLANRTLERTVMHQAYRVIEEAGPEGLTQASIGKFLGLGRLDRRLTCRQLLKEGSVSVKMQDVGRQRVTRYFAVRQHMKDLKFEREKLKFIELVGDVKILEKLLSRDLRNPNCVVRIMQEEAEEVVETIPEEGVYDEDGELIDADIAAAMQAIEQPTPSTSRETVLLPNDDIDNSAEHDVDPLNTSISDGSSTLVPPEDDSLMTYRTLRRINIILNEVLKCKVVDDISKFYKLIADGEREEGYEYKIDRKSLFRLIGKLQREKCVKLFKAVIKSDDKKKTLTFVCSAEIERDHASIQCAIEQAKFRIFNIPEVKPPLVVHGDPLLDQDSIILSVQEIQKLNSEANSTETAIDPLQKEYSNRYGHCPKFVRMRLLHKLLFYLTRDYLGDANTDQEAAIHKLQSMGHKLPDDLPQIYYSNAVDWKMFVPPLPKHGGWPEGWSILCDIVLRIPLSVFVRIMWIRYVIPGLDAYMSHPIKQHYLLGNLPRAIRSNLLAKRKFLFTLYETAQRLCFTGLLQFGPQRLKEKDQLFVYVNKNASIYDTTPSRIGYFQVSADMEYEKKLHVFNNAQDVDQYWCDLFNTCVLTQLGGKLGQEGKEIILESLENKPALLESCKVRTPDEAVTYDVGDIPGDHLGASGLDSAFFAHLKRNWCSKYLMINSNQESKNQTATSLAWGEEMPMEPRFEPTPKRKEVTKPETENKIVKTQPLVSKPAPSGIKKKPTFMPRPTKECKVIKRKIRRARITKKLKAIVNDEPKELGTFRARVTWTPEEDVYMLLCKVAGIFLSQDSTKTPIKGSLVAQVLNKCVHSTKPKTSDQCLRRMNYLYNRSESAQLDIAMCLEESRQDTLILEKFWNFQHNLRARKLTQEQYENAMDKGFEELVDMLKQKYRSVPDDMLDVSIPDTIEEFHQNFSVVNPYLSLRQRGKYSEPTTLEQVYFNVLVTLIFSSLGTSADKTNYSFQLLNIYQQYPDKWLRAAINKLRTDQMVSSKKLFARTLRHKTNQIPLTSTPFQLAMYYFHMMQSKYQYETFYEAWCALQRLREVGEIGVSLDLMTENGGRSACILEGICAGLVEMEIEMPAQIITLDFDSTIGEEEKTRLQQAYEEIIKNSHKLAHLTSKTADEPDIVADPMSNEVQDQNIIQHIPTHPTIKRPRDEETDQSAKATGSNFKDEISSPIKRLRLEENIEENSEVIIPEPLDVEQVASNDAVTNMDTTITDTRSVEKSTMSERDAIIRANVASRMAFYSTRDELRDQRSIDEGRDQRARLAMKPCEIICKFKQDSIINDIELNTIINALKNHNIIGGEMSSWEEVQQQYIEAGASAEDLDIALALVELIQKQHQIGATIGMLRKWFSTQSGTVSLASHLALLVSLKVLLRVGVTTIHYVYWTFKQPWLISSSKIKRLQREGLTPLSAVVLDLDDINVTTPQTIPSELTQAGAITEPCLNKSEECTPSQDDVEAGTSSQTAGTISGNITNKIKVTKKFEKSNVLVTSDKTAEEVAKQLELGNCGEKVLVAIRPWIRIDGTLNRRVLDRLLGAVLCHILYNPGITLKLAQERFCPALQPFHTFELLEILQVIGCVTISALLIKEKVTLFSKPSAPEIVPADFTEDETLIFVEPAMDAVLRMAQFIGDKSYSSDFLDDIKIRPYTEAPSQLLVVPDSQASQ